MKSLLNRILKNDLCSGCGLCSAMANEDAIHMQVSADGYSRPFLDPAYTDRPVANDTDCRVFALACPALNLDIRPYKSARYHPIWGELRQTLRGHASDPEIRQAGSSGGVISALAQYCLTQRLVDGVIQIRACTSDPLLNVTVISRSRENIIASSGSRYAPASPVEALKWVAMSTEKYLFIGKPCDVAAVRQLQAHDPRLRSNIPYLISFMCAGTPSIAGTHQLLKQLEAPRESVVAFRYRGDGWPGLARATLRNGESRTMTYHDSWGKVLNRHLQTRCKICPDGIGEFADIVCADGWEADAEGYPSFTEGDGQSLILLRTDKGQALFRNALGDGAVQAEAFDPEAIGAIQPFQYYRRATLLPRLLAMRLLLLKTPTYRGFELFEGVRRIGLVRSIKAFMGLLARRRTIKKRRLELA